MDIYDKKLNLSLWGSHFETLEARYGEIYYRACIPNQYEKGTIYPGQDWWKMDMQKTLECASDSELDNMDIATRFDAHQKYAAESNLIYMITNQEHFD